MVQFLSGLFFARINTSHMRNIQECGYLMTLNTFLKFFEKFLETPIKAKKNAL